MQNTQTKKVYKKPLVEVFSCRVEQGFAGSGTSYAIGGNNNVSTETMQQGSEFTDIDLGI